MSPDLKLGTSGGNAPDGWSCPSCGATVPHEAVLCMSCGYDKRTGRRLGDNGAPLLVPKRLIKMALGVGLIGAAVYIAINRAQQTSSLPPPHHAAVSPTTSVASIASPSAARAARMPATNTPTTAASVSSAPSATIYHRIEVDTNAVQRTRASLTLRVDQRFPPFAVGETVALRLTNGIIRRGIFGGPVGSNVVLAVGTNGTDQVPLVSLDTASRLRADPDYRVRYIEYWSQRGVKKAAGPK